MSEIEKLNKVYRDKDIHHLITNLNEKQKQIIRDNVSEEELFTYWLESFSEHTLVCDQCTLTWADEYCDDYKIFLKIDAIRECSGECGDPRGCYICSRRSNA